MRRDFPLGTIYLWSNSIATIPSTFRLCDGTNGTPDLRDKFIAGSGNLYSPDDFGGQILNQHSFTANSHQHTIPVGTALGAVVPYDPKTNEPLVSGLTDDVATLPPYHSLAYIQYKGVPI